MSDNETLIECFQSSNDRIGVTRLSELCRDLSNINCEISDAEIYTCNPVHAIKKLSEILLLFAEVCPVIYHSSVSRQLRNVAAYFRKRLLQQHFFVVDAFMTELKSGKTPSDKFMKQLVRELDSREWDNETTKEEKETIRLRQEAKEKYEAILPLYTKDLNRMYPDSPCPMEDETLYRVLNIYGGREQSPTGSNSHSPSTTSVTPSPFKNTDKQKIEADFERRSLFMKVKQRQQARTQDSGRRAGSTPRRRPNQNTIQIRPGYNQPQQKLTKEALQQHGHHQQSQQHSNMQQRQYSNQGMYSNPYANEEYWHYSNQQRYPVFAGRRALSDGGFEMEDRRDHARPQKAHSDDAGPIYSRQSPHSYDHRDELFEIGMNGRSFEPDFEYPRHGHDPSRMAGRGGYNGGGHHSPHGHHQAGHPSTNMTNNHLRQQQQHLRPVELRFTTTPSPPPNMQRTPEHTRSTYAGEAERMTILNSDGFVMGKSQNEEWAKAFQF